MAALLDVPLTIAPSLIRNAIEKQKDGLAWGLWKEAYPFMAAGMIKFVPYQDFKRKLTETKQTSKTDTEEIEKEMLALVAAYERGKP